MRYNKFLLLASTLLWSLAVVATSDAQTADTGQSAYDNNEVVVTARKRGAAERAQDVPISLSALSGAQIEAAAAEDLTDVAQVMPNVRLDTAGVYPGVANYAIRGMGFISSIASTEPTVGVFVDGVYIGSNLGGALDVYDTESVEVLRGPQGTLFGRNVTGGAVLVRSRRPDDEFAAVARVGVGNNGREMLSGSVEGGLTDTLAGRVFVNLNRKDGDFTNTVSGEDFGEESNVFTRSSLRWRPNSAVDVTLIGEYGNLTGDGAPSRLVNDPGTLATDTGVMAPSGIDNLSLNHEGSSTSKWTSLVLDANWNVAGGTVTSVTGYRNLRFYSQSEDGGPTEITNTFNAMDQEQFSEELRYAGVALDERLNYTVGVYYFQQSIAQQYHLDFFGTSVYTPRGVLDHQAASIFAQGDYEFAPDWYVTLGGRYTWEEKEATIARGGECDLQFNCTYSFNDSETWENFSPKIGVNWDVTDNILAYASWSRGFRSGGYNTRTNRADESPGPYDEETVEAFEIGFKSDLFDRTARLNVAVFHNEYEDLQRAVFDPVTVSNAVLNAASATVEGVEIEANWYPVKGLTLTGSVGYVDATYDSFDLLDVDADGAPDPDLARGLQLTRAPEWTYSLVASYAKDLAELGWWNARLAYNYTDETPLSDANSYFLDSYGLLDASLSWTSLDDHYRVAVWGKNLTDELYATTGATSNFFTTIYQSLPRTYGVELEYRF